MSSAGTSSARQKATTLSTCCHQSPSSCVPPSQTVKQALASAFSAELVPAEDTARILEKLRALGAKYFPTKEKMEQEIADFAGRVQLVALHIEHLTGKHVREK